MQQLSFLQNEMRYSAGLLPRMIRGLEQVCAVYYDAERRQTLIELSDDQGNTAPLILSDAARIQLAEWRSRKHQSNWYRPEELPFDAAHGSSKKIQLSIDDEDNCYVLMLTFRNVSDHSSDLLFLYLDKKMNHFGLQRNRGRGKWNQEHKLILQELLQNSVDLIIQEQSRNRSIYSGIINNREHLSHQLEQAQQDLEHRDRFYVNHIRDFVQGILEQSSKQSGNRFVLEEKVYQAVQSYRGSLDALEQSIRKACEVAINIRPSDSGIIKISLAELSLPESEQEASKEKTVEKRTIGFDRFSGTVELLDRYEQAAKLVQQSGSRIIGKNIGAYCNPSITNAAITDSIKKHALRILELFERYPERWELIRTQFKTIQNLTESRGRYSREKAC